MKKIFCFLMLCAGLLLAGCAAGFIPKDSKPAGVYTGILKGNVYEGPITPNRRVFTRES